MYYCEKYNYAPEMEKIDSALLSLASKIGEDASEQLLKTCFSFMDLTTLRTQDTASSVGKFVEKLSRLKTEYPSYPLPASVCVYPNFASLVRDRRCSPELHVTTVASCFPSAQSFLEVKVRECELAVQNGADEVDIVLAVNLFLDGDKQGAFDEIKAMREAIDKVAEAQGRKVVLKVILETGLLVSAENIAEASFLAMEAGADFIKTSTGKVEVNATPVAAYVMCECIAAFHAKTGRKVGFKAAGGISTVKDALCYYYIGSCILGQDWMNKDYFRFGVSRLGNALMTAIEQKTVTFF